MSGLVETLTGIAGLGLLFALTAWLPLKTGEGGCGGCGGECATCPELDATCASGPHSPGAGLREAKDRT